MSLPSPSGRDQCSVLLPTCTPERAGSWVGAGVRESPCVETAMREGTPRQIQNRNSRKTFRGVCPFKTKAALGWIALIRNSPSTEPASTYFGATTHSRRSFFPSHGCAVSGASAISHIFFLVQPDGIGISPNEFLRVELLNGWRARNTFLLSIDKDCDERRPPALAFRLFVRGKFTTTHTVQSCFFQ